MINLCMSENILYRSTYYKIFALPYFISLIFRWTIPLSIRKCVFNRKKSKEKQNCIKRLFTKNDNFRVPYISLISVFSRLAVLLLLINFSLKLTETISWNYYIIIWPYYLFLGISLILTCGTILLLFNWICMKFTK